MSTEASQVGHGGSPEDSDRKVAATTTAATDDDDDTVDTRCGFRNCKPAALQKCNNPKMLLLLISILCFAQGFVVNGINNVNTSTIERRFQLPSANVGLVSSSYDFSAAVFGIFISFFASGRNKARWLSLAAVAMALGCLVMSLPHFTTGLYHWGQGLSLLCINGTGDVAEKCSNSGLQAYLGVLIFGMVLNGLGGCVLYTVGVGYLDDSVPASESPLYLGFMYGASLLGPGLGYILGGQLLNTYVDFDKVDPASVPLKTTDPRWVGAWWVGFLISFALCVIAAVPTTCLGAEMPTAKAVRESRVSQMHKARDTSDGLKANQQFKIRDLPKAFCELTRNVPYLMLILAAASEGVVASGFATFMPKFIQNKFSVSAGQAAILTGIVAVPGAAGGAFVGGFICRRFNLKVKAMLKFAISVCVVTILLAAGIWVSCDVLPVAGLTYPYAENSTIGSLLSKCNQACGCTTDFYTPLCDTTGLHYFSACHAGCRTVDPETEIFSDCSCVDVPSGSNVSVVSSSNCEPGCGLLYLFLVLLFFLVFFTFLTGTPGDAASLRCIDTNYRTFSMGMKWLVIRLCGTVPGPVIFGAVTDVACLVWQTECGENSSCWIYDSQIVSRNYFLLSISAKVLSALLFFGAFWFYKPPKAPVETIVVKKESEPSNKDLDDNSAYAYTNNAFQSSESHHDQVDKSKDDTITNWATQL